MDTITTTPTNWKFYNNKINPNLGIITITFWGWDDSNDRVIGLRNIQFYYVAPPSGAVPTTNNF